MTPRAETANSLEIFDNRNAPGRIYPTVYGIAEIEGNYPSKGVGEHAAWFRDSEGNLLAKVGGLR